MRKSTAAILVALCLLVPASAGASLVTFYFAGSLVEVLDEGSPVIGTFSAGNTFTGRYTFDANQPNSSAVPTIGEYVYQNDSGKFSMQMTVLSNSGPVTIRSNTLRGDTSSITVANNHPSWEPDPENPPFYMDRYSVGTTGLVSSLSAMNQSSYFGFNITFASPDNLDLLTSIALPTTPLDLRLFSGELTPLDIDGDTTLRGTLTYFSTQPVPVPDAVWLLGSGLAGLMGLRRKLLA